MEENLEKDFAFFVLLVFSFFVFTAHSNLYKPFKMLRSASAMVLSDSTSSTGDSNTTTASPTPTPYIDNSGSGSNSSGDSSTVTYSPTPTLTTTSTSGDNTTTSTSGDSSTTTYSPTPFDDSSGSGSGGTTTTDRLASVDSATLSCIKSRLTSSEFDTLRFLVPTNSTEEETLKLLKEKAQVCFVNYSEATNINQATSFASELPHDSEDCLRKALGDEAFKEISSGLRSPTLEEKTRARSCFESETNTVVMQTQRQALSGDIDKCLVLALGNQRYREIQRKNTTLTIQEREKAQRCFGVSSNPLKPHVTYSLPEDVKSCLSSTVTDERMEELKLGKDKPTESEKEDVKSCLANLNDVQTKIVPAPSEEVPFMEEVKAVQVKSTFTQTVKMGENVEDKRLVLSGKGPKNTIVDIYIYSDPIVVTTQTDENGDFIYKMSEPLNSGSHIAYAVYKQNDGTNVRSAVYNFEVAAADTSANNLLNEEQASKAPNRFVYYVIAFVVAALGLSLIGVYFAFRTFRTKKTTSSADGKGESEGGTGTIN